MRVLKDRVFSPVTIVLESQKDIDNLSYILRAIHALGSYSGGRSFYGESMADLEKISKKLYDEINL